jgi:hypothetical protein
MRALLLGVLLAAGCSSNTAWKVSYGTPNPGAPASAHIHTSSEVAVAFGLLLFAGSIHELAFGEYALSARRPPEMDPNRKVSEQDCSKPLDYSLGNIRCK